jgi:hypothetical protein
MRWHHSGEAPQDNSLICCTSRAPYGFLAQISHESFAYLMEICLSLKMCLITASQSHASQGIPFSYKNEFPGLNGDEWEASSLQKVVIFHRQEIEMCSSLSVILN